MVNPTLADARVATVPADSLAIAWKWTHSYGLSYWPECILQLQSAMKSYNDLAVYLYCTSVCISNR